MHPGCFPERHDRVLDAGGQLAELLLASWGHLTQGVNVGLAQQQHPTGDW
jgi:hypothetical protein